MEKLRNIKIAFIDIDGTLSNSERKISDETKEAIKNATNKGLIVVLCSGRNNGYVYNASKNCNASQYIISCNGAEIFDYKNNLYINNEKISFNDLEIIWDYCINNNLGCILNCNDKRFCNINHYIEQDDKSIISSIDSLNDDVYQMVTFGYEYERMNNLEKLIKIGNLQITNPSSSYLKKDCSSHHFFFDINTKGVNKGNAIKKLLNYLNLTKENAIGFGDNVNDFDLFSEVGFKIAMGNANERLKKIADYTTLSNDEHGVAYFLNNFIDYN